MDGSGFVQLAQTDTDQTDTGADVISSRGAIDAGRAQYAASVSAGLDSAQALEAAVATIEQVALEQGASAQQVARLVRVAQAWFAGSGVAGLGVDSAAIEAGFSTLGAVVDIMDQVSGGAASPGGVTLDRAVVEAAIEAGREHFENSIGASADPAAVIESTAPFRLSNRRSLTAAAGNSRRRWWRA